MRPGPSRTNDSNFMIKCPFAILCTLSRALPIGDLTTLQMNSVRMREHFESVRARNGSKVRLLHRPYERQALSALTPTTITARNHSAFLHHLH